MPPRPKAKKAAPAKPAEPTNYPTLFAGGAPSAEPSEPSASAPSAPAPGAPGAPAPMTVGQLTRLLKGLIEETLPPVRVVGEIGNFVRAASGHLYLSLRDEEATLSAVMWRSTAARLRFEPTDGLRVVASGRLTVYPPRGSYQLTVDRLEPVGVGEMELALRRLLERLSAEGLFDPARKRRLPLLPRTLALVTSPTGAAVQDMLQVIARRCPAVRVLIAPVRVQGDGAAEQVAGAVLALNHHAAALGGIDVIIVGRGGGSSDDLSAFNAEVVARAIAGSAIPVISAVGHEIDVTVADRVADVRALTPSEAAERAVPELAALLAELREAEHRLAAGLSARLRAARDRVDRLARRRVLTDPMGLLRASAEQLDDAAERLAECGAELTAGRQQQLAELAGRLEALSPLGVLARGYALVQRAADGALVRQPEQAPVGTRLRIRLAAGELNAEAL